jgi:hypothetical protein
MPLILFSVAALYTKSGQWLLLAWFAGCFIGYLGLVDTSHPTATTPEFYIEKLYLPLAVFSCHSICVGSFANASSAKTGDSRSSAHINHWFASRMYATHPLYTNRMTRQKNAPLQIRYQKVIRTGQQPRTLLAGHSWCGVCPTKSLPLASS